MSQTCRSTHNDRLKPAKEKNTRKSIQHGNYLLEDSERRESKKSQDFHNADHFSRRYQQVQGNSLEVSSTSTKYDAGMITKTSSGFENTSGIFQCSGDASPEDLSVKSNHSENNKFGNSANRQYLTGKFRHNDGSFDSPMTKSNHLENKEPHHKHRGKISGRSQLITDALITTSTTTHPVKHNDFQDSRNHDLTRQLSDKISPSSTPLFEDDNEDDRINVIINSIEPFRRTSETHEIELHPPSTTLSTDESPRRYQRTFQCPSCSWHITHRCYSSVSQPLIIKHTNAIYRCSGCAFAVLHTMHLEKKNGTPVCRLNTGVDFDLEDGQIVNAAILRRIRDLIVRSKSTIDNSAEQHEERVFVEKPFQCCGLVTRHKCTVNNFMICNISAVNISNDDRPSAKEASKIASEFVANAWKCQQCLCYLYHSHCDQQSRFQLDNTAVHVIRKEKYTIPDISSALKICKNGGECVVCKSADGDCTFRFNGTTKLHQLFLLSFNTYFFSAMCTDNESDFSDYELQVDNARPHLTSNTANETLAKHSQPIQHHPQASKTPTLPERAPKPDIGHSALAPRETKRSPCPSPKLVAKPHSQFLHEEKHIADYSHHKQSRSPAIQPVLGMAGLSSSISPVHDTTCADGNSRNKSTSQAVIDDTPIPVRVSSFRRPPQTAKLPKVCDATSITASAPSSEPLDLISIKDIKQEFNLSDDVTDESDYEVASDDHLPSIDVKKGTISNNETPSHQRDKVSLTQSTNEHDNTVQSSFPNPNHSDPIDDPLPSPVIRKQRKAHTREPKLIPQHAPKSVNDSPKASLHINQPTSRTPVSDTFNVSKPQQTLLSNVSKHKPSQTPSTTNKQEYKRKTNTDANTTPSKRTIPALKPSSGAIAESKSGIFTDSSKTFHRSISNEPSSLTPPSLPSQFGTTTAKERNPAIGDAGSSNEMNPLLENIRNSVSGYEVVHICGKDGCDFTARHLCRNNSHHVAPGSHWQRTNPSSCADQATFTKLPQHLGFQPRIIFPREHVHCEGCRFSFTHESCFHADTDDGQRLQVLPRVLKYCCKFCNLEIFFSAVPLSHLSIDIDHSCGFLKATSRGGVS